jgi:Fic family protein
MTSEHLEAHNSTAIDGNTLILREVEVLLETGRAVGAKELRDYLEVAGYGQAARWVYTQALTAGGWQSGNLITVTEIRHIHTVAMGPVWEVAPRPDAAPTETPGSFRRHDIHPSGGGMTPPAWTDVPSELASWVRDVATCSPTLSRPGTCRSPWPGCTAPSSGSIRSSTATVG